MAQMNFRKQFEDIYKANIKREGAAEFLKYLDSTDFFYCSASIKYHSNFSGGLVEHSVKVYNRFLKLLEIEYGKEWLEKNLETATVISLLHDVCKVNCYKTEMRNVKQDGEWVQKPHFVWEDALPYGHGEKSVYIIGAFMKLTREEAMAINWHMGGFDARNANGNYAVSGAFSAFPMAVLFHAADMMTTYLDEKVVK
jgi:hypothetical protein